jgi:aspartyl-tRNA(Asn)/glutamyl-tRNA(Gln) amidotransferase subunit B
LGGFVNIVVNGENKRINITRAHIEEDAGKTIHPAGKNYSLVDLNRAGTPLLEIVSEPDMHNAEEAREFAHELYLLMKYADVSTADLYQGNMRFDVNVSVSKNNQLGTRSETKNLNSFRSVEKAVNFEIDRQIKLLEAGKKVVQETRGWDDAKQKTFSQRSKEDAHDYRYFPEPDVPPVLLSKAYVDKLRQEIKISPDHLREMLNKLNLDKSSVDTLVEEMVAGRFIVEVINHSDNAISRRISNWLTSDVQGLVSAGKLSWDTARLNVDSFIDLAKAVLDNKISSTNSKVIIEKMIIDGGSPLEIAKANNLIQMSDESELVNMAKQVLADNPKAAQDYRNGEDKVMGFLVGQVMKLSKGQANPQVSATILKDLLK